MNGRAKGICRVAIPALTALTAIACGARSSPASSAPTTYAEATGRVECTPGAAASPFIIDLPPDRRGDIELVLKKELVAVAYDCQKLALLPDCRLGGEYQYTGLTLREQVITIANEAEVRANLPLGGLGIAGQVGGEFQHGSTLDVALAIVGQKSGVKRSVLRSDLVGQCAGATHFIRSALLGAFAMQKGSRNHVRTAAQLFGVGGSVASSNLSAAINKDGRLEACRQASSAATEEPQGCAAPLRVELVPFLDKPDDVAVANEAEAAIAPSCPAGMKADDAGKCTMPNVPYVCDYQDVQDCEAQCKRGSMGSCAILARSYQLGRSVGKDVAKSISLYTTACNGGAAPACGRLGEMLLGVKDREKEALELLDRACFSGWMTACTIAGQKVMTGPASRANAFDLFSRGCRGGDAESCWSLGYLFKEGVGVAKNDAEATRFFKLGCDGGARLGCSSYAEALDTGSGVQRDEAAAIAILSKACERGFSASCSALSKHYFLGRGVPADSARGIQLLERACEGTDRASCLLVGLRYNAGVGVPADKAKATRYLNRGCEAGDPLACQEAAKVR